MKFIASLAIGLALLVEASFSQTLADLARKERERKAQQQKSGIEVSTDQLKTGKLDLSPPLEPAKKGDMDYLFQQLVHPKPSTELLAAFVPLKDRAVPRLAALVETGEPLKRVAPATVLIVLGRSEGFAALARLLTDTTKPSAAATAPRGESLRKQIEESRIAAYALDGTEFGIWRFTEGRELAPEQVVGRLEKGPPIEIVGGVDNGQRIFNRALRDSDPNVRRGAVALIRVATGGKDFGFQFDAVPDQNEAAIQQITTFLTTERAKVISALSPRSR